MKVLSSSLSLIGLPMAAKRTGRSLAAFESIDSALRAASRALALILREEPWVLLLLACCSLLRQLLLLSFRLSAG